MTLAALGRWGVVHKVWVRGQRREHYQAETDFWKMISGRAQRAGAARDWRRRRGGGARREDRARGSGRPRRTGASRRAKAEADFLVERVVRLGEICRLGETMLDMLLGQLTLDVGRFRDAFKVALRLAAGRPREPPAPLPARAQRRRRGAKVRDARPSRAAAQMRPATPPRGCRARARARTPSEPRAAATSGSIRPGRRCAGRTPCRDRRGG